MVVAVVVVAVLPSPKSHLYVSALPLGSLLADPSKFTVNGGLPAVVAWVEQ